MVDQERVVDSLKRLFEDAIVIDRREHPSHGYRAVHVIIKHAGKLVEIQIRTSLQQVWAELSEKLSDLIDPAIKYGRGLESAQEILRTAAQMVVEEENTEVRLAKAKELLANYLKATESKTVDQTKVADIQKKIDSVRETLLSVRRQVFEGLQRIIEDLASPLGDTHDLSD